MLDSVQLTAQIEQHQRVLLLCPRRCGKHAFLANYIDGRTEAETVFLGLTGHQCDEMRRHLNRRVLCAQPGHQHDNAIKHAALLVVDEALFMNERALFPLFDQQRIVCLSSLSPDLTALQRFIAAGFVTINAPMQQR